MATSKDEKSLLLPLLAGMVALSTALAVGLLFWAGGDDETEELGDTPVTAMEAELPAPPSSEDPATSSPDGRVGGGEIRQPAVGTAEPGKDPPPPNFSEILSQGESGEVGSGTRDEMRAIAESSGSQAQKVAKFKSYLTERNDGPTQNLAVRHLSKLVKDEQYNEYLADELMDPNQSEVVRAALIRDINARNRQVMLPVMVEIVTQTDHPLKEYAQETLGRYLGDGYSADPESLRGAVNAFMREQNGDL